MTRIFTTLLAIFSCIALSGCGTPTGDPELTKNVEVELVDWHIVGLWVINTPSAWLRVTNYNNVPIKNICIKYTTYGFDGEELNHGYYTMDKEDDVVQPFGVYNNPKNFNEQYLGIVDVESDMLKVELVSVTADDTGWL